MKGLSIEQKAKAYDEAIERANSLLSSNELGNAWIYKLLPELKESEDERIRKAMIDYFKWNPDGQLLNEFSNREVFAWLEKQGEQNPVNEDAEKEKYDYVSGQFLYCKGSFNEFKEGESYWLDYIGNDIYVGRSDNILNQKFHITPRQLYTWLDPRHPEDSNKCEQKPAWSEEDEKKLLCVCAWIKDYPRIADFKDEMYTVANNYINWLKSLKDKVGCEVNCTTKQQWKPSDEQIRELGVVATGKGWFSKEILSELLEQLKKLMEE